LKVKVTYDVTFSNTMDEQREAITHLKALKPGDVVIYDRGYISYALLYWHAGGRDVGTLSLYFGYLSA